jgi:hypothetical protein
MAGGRSTDGIGENAGQLHAAQLTDAQLVEFAEQARCADGGGHWYPALAGACPEHGGQPSSRSRPFLPVTLTAYDHHEVVLAVRAVNPLLAAFIDSDVLKLKDNGKAPRWYHAFGYETRKLGVVNHIPVAKTLAQLTAYFNGGNAQGSTHFGVDRGVYRMFAWGRARVPVAEAHQYMPIVGPVAPWAQGVINCGGSCRVQCHPRILAMRSGEPNGAYVSIENVDAGQTVPDDAQFNTNCLLRAYVAAYFGHAITPDTQVWHSEIDRVNRCGDPPWSGAIEAEMQAAANRLLAGDVSGLRAIVSVDGDGDMGMTPEERARLAWCETEIARLSGLLFGAGAFLKDSGTADDRRGVHYHADNTMGRPTPRPVAAGEDRSPIRAIPSADTVGGEHDDATA